MATYKVQPNGKAPTGLKQGDTVVTGGGTYQITGVNADGSYKSTKVNNTTTSNYTGTYASAPTTTTTPSAPATSTSAPTGYSGSANAVTTYNQNQNNIINQMNQNSIAWHTADAATKKQLEAANQALAQLLGGNVTHDPHTGYWSGSADAPVEVPQTAPTYSYSAAQPTYNNSQYGAHIDALLNQILSREAFSYNAETDPLYQQYATQYEREGNRAMNDTLASAASTAGGMNSYAITAAQQANDYYNTQLADKIPELYQLAYSMYLDDIDLKVQDLGLLTQMDDRQYNRYRDTMADWRDDRDFTYNQYRDDVADYQWGTSFNYNANRDAVTDAQWEKTFGYNAERDAVADSQWEKEFDYGVERDELSDSRYDSETAYNKAMDMLTSGVMPDSATLKAAGISDAEATAYLANWNSKNAKSSSSSSSSSSGGGGGDGDGNGNGNGYTGKPPVDPDPDPAVTDPWQLVLKDLGVGVMSAETIDAISTYGGIVETADGHLEWANGWNKDNWSEKLKQAQTGSAAFPFGKLTLN